MESERKKNWFLKRYKYEFEMSWTYLKSDVLMIIISKNILRREEGLTK